MNLAGVHIYADETVSVQSRNKSVHFNCPFDTSLSSLERSSSGAYRHSLEKFESLGDKRTSKLSPYPTPLKLIDEMQTPGTVFASYRDFVNILMYFFKCITVIMLFNLCLCSK